MQLVSPSKKYQTSYSHYIAELADEERYPFPLDFDYSNFDALLQKLADFAAGNKLPEGYVPSTTLWLVEGHELLGVTNVRHYLNERIQHCGGHIGLGIRPAYRGQGLGKKLMQLSIQYLKQKGVTPIHIHCYKNNHASAHCITSNGGILESELNKDGVIVNRFIVI
ncbi:GNAT family N-acetyltransferase [Rheinheimera sp. MMS21-TC3]|uniref:GNAT family N-acetyltransferase n=1 Tax=Rheinheimera sp. MMS21-TC3 TaxID=3072790 RepID=UPI0028C39285|nr:GNAT family N-acetyltransferase [Rheinheimera sp. MMS21-TC3]WNO60844.1 GNAT family N-acetyltransferase [Rheinheimera sp. MMS21-TC3]